MRFHSNIRQMSHQRRSVTETVSDGHWLLKNLFCCRMVVGIADGPRHRSETTAAVGSPSRPVSQQSKYSKMGSHVSSHSLRQQHQRQTRGSQFNLTAMGGGGHGSVYPPRAEAMLNDKYSPRDEFFNKDDDGQEGYPKHPCLQVRGLCYQRTAKSESARQSVLDNISMEAKAGEIIGILATSGESQRIQEFVAWPPGNQSMNSITTYYPSHEVYYVMDWSMSYNELFPLNNDEKYYNGEK